MDQGSGPTDQGSGPTVQGSGQEGKGKDQEGKGKDQEGKGFQFYSLLLSLLEQVLLKLREALVDSTVVYVVGFIGLVAATGFTRDVFGELMNKDEKKDQKKTLLEKDTQIQFLLDCNKLLLHKLSFSSSASPRSD